MSGPKKNSVLIIDDDKLAIIALTDILCPDYTVYAVKDGQDAIERANMFLPDVILLDVIMMDMDGHTVIKELKGSEKTKNIPVIFITGLSGSEDEKKGFKLGAADYITKPFIPDIVKLRVQNQIKIINQTNEIIEKEYNASINRAKMDFLLGMNHEMLTPMNAILGMTQIAKMTKNPDEITDCLGEIETASRELLELIYDLLNNMEREFDI